MTTLNALRFSLSTLSRRSFTKFTKAKGLNVDVNHESFSRCMAYSLFNNYNKCQRNHLEPASSSSPILCSRRFLFTKPKKVVEKSVEQQQIEEDIFDESSKLGLFARFKLMYRKYWYVLIPVHCVTSAGWLAGFYYLSQSGVDVPSLLQYFHISESIIDKVKDSQFGHLAVAYICYKVSTPLRYAVTLGGTTISIKYLVKKGHIKPVPTRQQFIKMYEDKRSDLKSQKQDHK